MTATSTLTARSPGRGASTRMVANEADKAARVVWSYRATFVPTLAGLVVTYLVFQYFVGGGRIVDGLVVDTAPAMFAYVVSYLTIMRLVAGILEERNAGTLEQTHLSPLPAGQLVIGRVAVALTEAVLAAVVVVAAVLAGVGVGYPARWDVVVPGGLMLAGITGFALLIAAASFTYPGIGALVHIIQMALMMLNGTIVPVDVFPGWLELTAKLAPATLGVGAARRVLIEGDSLADLAGDGALGWLILHTVVLVAAGWFAYRWQVRRALRDGRLGPA